MARAAGPKQAGSTEELAGPQFFESSQAHILAELERVDLLIQARIRRARELHAGSEQFQGLYISESEIDNLLSQPAGLPRWALDEGDSQAAQLKHALRELRAQNAARASASKDGALRLLKLTETFALTQFEVDALLIVLAPELDSRYERFFSYLQDDVTKKRPSIDLILNLLCHSPLEKLQMRMRFEPHSPLIEERLLEIFDEASQPHATLLGRYARVDDRIVQYLLESDHIDSRLSGLARIVEATRSPAELVLAEAEKETLSRLATQVRSRPAIIYLQGGYGTGKQATAEAIAHIAGRRLLVADGARIAGADAVAAEKQIRLALREARLQEAALYWEGFGALLAEDRNALRRFLLAELEKRQELAFLAGDAAWEPVDELRSVPFVRLELQMPAYAARRELWKRAISQAASEALDIESVANQFRLSGGQIEDAAATARHLAHRRKPEAPAVTTAELYEAARIQSSFRLASLARKLRPLHVWSDIILPQDRIQQLRELCNYVKYRSLVYEEWEFDRKLSTGKGLNALFAGPPGTGKTMAAGIIAGELGLDIYKIDLSAVVSKYIGETEKNLSRIFNEAENSNAILFFDEADALFGKRSEVRDSHDRYANIETGYLLQRMEEYEGVVLLATNFRRNMDEAFVRRLHFAVEFPFPGEHERRMIWEGVWPKATPRASDFDLELMARQFELAGGNIRNIVLSAAFLAAEDGRAVTMTHLLHATRREYQKMGKVLMEREFEPILAFQARENA